MDAELSSPKGMLTGVNEFAVSDVAILNTITLVLRVTGAG